MPQSPPKGSNGASTASSRSIASTSRFAPGEIYGFLGPNGAGKSTTVRVLCTLLAPTGGRAIVAGPTSPRDPEQVRLRIGVALQDAALDPKADRYRAAAPASAALRTDARRSRSTHRRARRARSTSATRSAGRSAPTPAACGGASTSRPRSCTTRRSCSSTSRPTGLDPVSRARVWEEVRA